MSMIPLPSTFMPLPLPMMIPFMAMQSFAMAEQFGKGFQYGKRKISAMKNAKFNALTPEKIQIDFNRELKGMIPQMQESLQSMRPLVSTVLEEMFAMIGILLKTTPSLFDPAMHSIFGKDFHIPGAHPVDKTIKPPTAHPPDVQKKIPMFIPPDIPGRDRPGVHRHTVEHHPIKPPHRHTPEHHLPKPLANRVIIQKRTKISQEIKTYQATIKRLRPRKTGMSIRQIEIIKRHILVKKKQLAALISRYRWK